MPVDQTYCISSFEHESVETNVIGVHNDCELIAGDIPSRTHFTLPSKAQAADHPSS